MDEVRPQGRSGSLKGFKPLSNFFLSEEQRSYLLIVERGIALPRQSPGGIASLNTHGQKGGIPMDRSDYENPKYQRAMDIIMDLGRSKAATEAEIRKAFASTLEAFLKAANEDEDLLRKVFVLFEGVAKVGDAKKIQCHPMRPEGIDQDVETLREARKGKPKKKPEPKTEG